MQRRILVLLAFALLAVPLCAETRARAVGRTPLTPLEWLRASAVPFDTTEARTGLADLAPLRRFVGNARMVALGEATHGTHEFFTMKHRVLEFLVEEMGFTVFAIEANLPEADRVNDYVLNGTGDPAAALSGMYFWTWNTDEVLDMILWMREYNLRRGDRPPVKFRGFDDQFTAYARQQVEAYLRRVDPGGAATITAAYGCVEGLDDISVAEYQRKVSAAKRSACTAALQAACDTIRGRAEQYAARSSREEFENVARYARVIAQAQSLLAGTGIRDAFMAENVEWLADTAHPGEKLVLWAHNLHVSGENQMGFDSMGANLRKRFARDVMLVGFSFDHGGFNAVWYGSSGPSAQWIAAGPDTGWEPFFREAASPRFFLDLRKTPWPAVNDYLNRGQMLWDIGAAWTGSNGRSLTRLMTAYDLMIYIEVTTPSRLR